MTKGTTFHRRFGIPVDCTEYSTSSMKPTSNEAMTIKHAVIIFVDEVSMMKWNQLQVMDRLLRSIMSIDKPMGNKLVVRMHDFRQLLPVVPGGSRAKIICEAVINSHIWNHFTTFSLKTNMRVMTSRKLDDPAQADKLDEYAKWLLSIGDGTVEQAYQGSNVSYYLTINRAQGQSLKRAGLYLPKNVFTHGHLYVGLSRCGDPDHVFICSNQEEFNHVSHLLDPSKKYTKNVVYKEIFKDNS